MSRLVLCLLLLCSLFSSGYAATVDISVDVGREEALFQYIIIFEEEEEFSSFSFEKPEGSRILISEDEAGQKLRYSTAGDYFIFKPNFTEGRVFKIVFDSTQAPLELKEEQSYSNYVNFNFPVSSLGYTLSFVSDFGEVQEVFPRNFQVLDDDSYFWEIQNPDTDTLFLVSFPREGASFSSSSFNSPFFWGVLVGVLFLVALLLFFFTFRRRKRLQVPQGKKNTSKEEKTSSERELKEEDEFSKQSFEEIVQKYLTETEAEVVRVIKDNKGISQYDILNFLPSMTKSNLSKIITKLHGKKFLSRIKVGKVNKIYLGERLESDED